MHSSRIVHFLHAASYFSFTAANCYLPNGTDANLIANSTTFMSCNTMRPGGSHSMCCDLGSGNDVCLPSGLCRSFNGRYERRSCTDPTWKDPGCLKLYIDGIDHYGQAYADMDSELLNCTDGSWCAHSNNYTCCERNEGFKIDDNGVVSPNTAAASVSTTALSQTISSLSLSIVSHSTSANMNIGPVPPEATIAVTSIGSTGPPAMTPASSPDSNSDDHASASLPVGVIVGGAIGGVVGLGLVIALIMAVALKYKRQLDWPKAEDEVRKEASFDVSLEKHKGTTHVIEMEQPASFHEVGGPSPVYELSPN